MRAATAAVVAAIVFAALAAMYAYQTHTAAADAVRTSDAARTREAAGLTDRTSDLERELASRNRRVQRAEGDAAALRRQLAAAKADLATATEQLAALTADAEPPVVANRRYPAFLPEGLEEALADIDWDVVGTSMSSMPPLISELAAALADGRAKSDLPAETIGAIQRHNGPILAAAMKLAQRDIAGKEVNSAFTHPGFVSNALAAALDALELPLTDEQQAALERITHDYSARETRRVAAYDDATYVLEEFVDESLLKHAYYAEVYRVLTKEQHDAIRPESVRGRTKLDIFGRGLVWTGRAGPVLSSDREELAAKVTEWVTRRGGIADDQREHAQEIVGAWAEDLPEAFVAWEPDALVKAGMLQAEHVEDSGARVLALLRTLDTELELDDAGHKRLRAVPGTVVVYMRPAPDDS